MNSRPIIIALVAFVGCAPAREPTPVIGPDFVGVAPMYGVDAPVLAEIVRGLVDEDLAEQHDRDAEVLAALRSIAHGQDRPVPLHEATAALVVYRREKSLTLDEAAAEARRQLRMNSAMQALQGRRHVP
jgi:hypothetical protein